MAVGAYVAGYAASIFGSVQTPDGPVDFANPLGVLVYFLVLALSLAILAGGLVLLTWLVHKTYVWHRKLPVALGWLLVVWAFIDLAVSQQQDNPGRYFVWYQTAHALWAGFNHLLALVPMPRANANLSAAWCGPTTMLVLLIGGGSMAAAAGFLVGLPTLRLRGDYLAIATLGFAKIISDLINICDPLGGARGLSVPVYHLDDGMVTTGAISSPGPPAPLSSCSSPPAGSNVPRRVWNSPPSARTKSPRPPVESTPRATRSSPLSSARLVPASPVSSSPIPRDFLPPIPSAS